MRSTQIININIPKIGGLQSITMTNGSYNLICFVTRCPRYVFGTNYKATIFYPTINQPCLNRCEATVGLIKRLFSLP